MEINISNICCYSLQKNSHKKIRSKVPSLQNHCMHSYMIFTTVRCSWMESVYFHFAWLQFNWLGQWPCCYRFHTFAKNSLNTKFCYSLLFFILKTFLTLIALNLFNSVMYFYHHSSWKIIFKNVRLHSNVIFCTHFNL